MKKRTTIWTFACFVIIGFLVLSPFALNAIAGPKVLKLAHQWPKGDIRDQWGAKWAELVENKTNGSLKFRLYPASSLYKAKAQPAALKKGALDACVLPFIYLSGKIPAYALTSMPGVVKNANQGTKWGGSKIGEKLDEIGQKNGFRTLSWGCIMGSIGNKKNPVLVPSDLKGYRVRGAGWAMEEVLKAGGASITSMPSTEVYFGLQTGALDGLTTTYSSFRSFRLHEVLDHLTISKEYGIFYAHHGILMSNTAWGRLNASEQKAVVEAGKEVEPFFLGLANDILDKTKEEFKNKGVQVHELSEENFSKWYELAKETAYKTYVKRVENGQQLLDLALEVK
jgi:TRAP-type C4-dicarboxylate transport system substrate-binding protein